MGQPLVSVLLPVYNAAEYVDRAILSVLNQTFKDFELIIVDDGSTDATKAVIESIDDPRIHLICANHRGIAESLNLGLTQLRSNYIARMDADDFCEADRLTKQVEYLELHPQVGAVACKVKYNSFHSLADGYKNYVDWTNELLTPEDIMINRFVESPLAHPSIVFRKSLIESFGSYTTEYVPEDYELWLRWMDHGVSIAKIDEELLTWNDRRDRLSRVDDHYREEAFYLLKARYFKRWYEKEGGNRKVFVWGRGNVMRRRLKPFNEEQIPIAGYIDIANKTVPNSIYFKNVGVYKREIVLGFVADKKGKNEISDFLKRQGLQPGKDFFHMV
ncbi:MAG: glycosyltransferase [Bacteroidota bacterium]